MHLSITFTSFQPLKDLSGRVSDALLHPARVVFNGRSVDVYNQNSQLLAHGTAHRIAMGILAIATCLFGLLGLLLAMYSTTRNLAFKDASALPTATPSRAPASVIEQVIRVTREDLPDEILETILDTTYVKELGHFAATYRLGSCVVKDKLWETLKKVEKQLGAIKKAIDERPSALEAEKIEESENTTPAGRWVQETEKSVLEVSKAEAVQSNIYLDKDLEELQKIIKEKDLEKRAEAIQSFMKRVFNLIHLPKNLQVHQLPDLIVRIYNIAHRQDLSLSAYLRKLAEVKAELMLPIRGEAFLRRNLPYLLRPFDDDPFAMRIAVTQYGLALEHASERLRDDPETVRTAVAQDGSALQYASARLRNDPETVRTAVVQNGLALQYASHRLKNDPIIVRTAVAQNGRALLYANEKRQNDLNIAIIAIAQNPSALFLVSPRFLFHSKVQRIAFDQNTFMNKFKRSELRGDPETVKIAVTQYGQVLEFISAELKNDPEIVKIAVTQNGSALYHADAQLKNDPKIVRIAIAQDPFALFFASARLRDDSDMVRIALALNGEALQYASERLRNDPEMIKLANRQNLVLRILQGVLTYFSDKCKQECFEPLKSLIFEVVSSFRA